MPLSGLPHGASSFGMPILGSTVLTTGNVFWVNSNTGSAGGFADDGMSPDQPLSTLQLAMNNCTASHGDIIFVAETHAETITLTTQNQLSTAGVTIIGLGAGDKRPTFTINANHAKGLRVTGTDCIISNIRFISGTSIGVQSNLLYVAANNTRFIGCQFKLATPCYYPIEVISGNDVWFDDCFYQMALTARVAGQVQSFALVRSGNVTFNGGRYRDFPDTTQKIMKAHSGAFRVGGLGAVEFKNTIIETRGLAIKARSAGVSAAISLVGVRAIGTSSNQSAGQANLIAGTYVNWLDTICITQVNKRPTTYPAATES